MKKRLHYLIPPAVTLVIYSIILAVKGIFPFGNNTIDYYDMAQQIAAFYYHVYDSLHGTKSFFYDWYSALGTNMAMSTSGCSNISPFNLFFLLIPRSSLLKSLSVFNGLKLMCMSFTMYFYLHKTHAKSPAFFKLIASVGYSFCGFVLVLYITNQWVDIAIMFPLIMYFYDKLIADGKMAGYIITLSVTIIASYYLGFMILIFIFLYTGLKMISGYLFDGVLAERTPELPSSEVNVEETSVEIPEEPEKSAEPSEKKGLKAGFRKKMDSFKNRPRTKRTLPDVHLPQLGIGTFISLALSSFILIPQLTQMLSSARFKNGSESEGGGIFGEYFAILSHVKGDYTTRWWTLLGLSFCTAVILTGIIRYRKERKLTFMTISMVLLVVLELFVESINLIWHFGSYVQYPIRNGFIINFVFAYLACMYAGKMYRDEEETEASAAGNTDRYYLSFVVTLIGFLIFIAFFRSHPGMPIRRVFHITSAIMAATFVYYFILLNIEELKRPLHILKKKREEEKEKTDMERRSKARYKWAAGIILMEVLCYGFLLFGKPDFVTGYAEEPEQNGEFVYICEQLRNEFDLGNEFIFRVKNPDESLNANYGFVLMQPALSNWTHMIAPFEQAGAASWGYSVEYTRLLDAGGTVFSDALIGVRNVISMVPLDERLYEKVKSAEVSINHLTGETAEYTLYKPRYTLPFGLVIKEDAKSIEDTSSEDIVSLHNIIYHAIDLDGADISDDENPARWYIRENAVSGKDSSMEDSRTSGMRVSNMKIKVEDETALYLLGTKPDTEFANSTITVGMENVKIPTIGYPDNIEYPAHFNNNAVYLGTFKDETVEIGVQIDLEKGDDFGIEVIGISLDMLDSLCADRSWEQDGRVAAGGRELALNVTASDPAKEEYLLLPVTYDKGWKIRVNDKRVKASSYAGLFTLIPLAVGENTVTMKFTPPGTVFGTVISVLTLLLCLAYIIVSRVFKEKLAGKKEFMEAAASAKLGPVYAVVFLLVLLIMYIVPILYGIVSIMR